MLRVVGRMGADDGANESWPLGDDATIDDFHSVYHYHESIEDLKYKLLYATLELESLLTSSKEETRRKDEELRRKEESIAQLSHHLKVTTQERDEARDQLLMLLNKISNPSNSAVPLQPESPQFRPTRGNSSITDSDSLSETYNHHRSYVSSPVESFDLVTSPELSNMNMIGPCNTAAPYQSLPPQCNSSPIDQGSMIIDCLAMRRGLPEKGKLLEAVQTVTQANPLLETLLTTGPLPQWRNPPPLQLFPMPAVMVGGHGGQALNPTVGLSPNVLVQRGLNGFHHEKSTGLCTNRLSSFQRSTRKQQIT